MLMNNGRHLPIIAAACQVRRDDREIESERETHTGVTDVLSDIHPDSVSPGVMTGIEEIDRPAIPLAAVKCVEGVEMTPASPLCCVSESTS